MGIQNIFLDIEIESTTSITIMVPDRSMTIPTVSTFNAQQTISTPAKDTITTESDILAGIQKSNQ